MVSPSITLARPLRSMDQAGAMRKVTNIAASKRFILSLVERLGKLLAWRPRRGGRDKETTHQGN